MAHTAAHTKKYVFVVGSASRRCRRTPPKWPARWPASRLGWALAGPARAAAVGQPVAWIEPRAGQVGQCARGRSQARLICHVDAYLAHTI